MQENQWKQIDHIFSQAVILNSSQRYDFVRRRCYGENHLYNEVISLLDADSKSDRLFENSVVPIICDLLTHNIQSFIQQSEFASYKIKKLLGQGGAGAVFLAEDPRLNRNVAIKILPRFSAHSADLRRFRREALASSSVVHQNVAHIYEFDHYDGVYYLAMEYVKGKTLREMLAEPEEISLPQTMEIVIQTAQALRAAHKQHIYHRDIKPENIMLTEEALVKVLDFGLAKNGVNCSTELQSRFDTIPGLILGTTAYMSPEQIRSDSIDGKTDLWSLGVVFYEMLTGERPFQGRTCSDIQAGILLSEHSTLPLKDKPQCIGKIINRLLAKNVDDRYQDAAELISDLAVAQREVYDFIRKDSLFSRVARLFKDGLSIL